MSFNSFVLVCLFFCACTTQNRQEKSFVSKLNGQNVEAGMLDLKQGTGLSIPLRTKHLNTSIKGSCEYEDQGQLQPLRGAKIYLKKNEQIFLEGQSQLDGTFHLNGRVDDGDYRLLIEGQDGKILNHPINVKGFSIEAGRLFINKK